MKESKFSNENNINVNNIKLVSPPSLKLTEDWATLLSDELVIENLKFFKKIGGWSYEDSKARIEQKIKEQKEEKRYDFDIFLSEGNNLAFVGGVGFRLIEIRNLVLFGEIGVIIGRKYWRTGLATKALILSMKYGFEELKLDVVEAKTSDSNEKTKNLFLNKLLFKLDGNEEIYNEKWVVMILSKTLWNEKLDYFYKFI